jgi:hypothetical protein
LPLEGLLFQNQTLIMVPPDGALAAAALADAAWQAEEGPGQAMGKQEK